VKSIYSNSLALLGEYAAFYPTIENSISVTFSAKKGIDHVKRSIFPGKWNG
jgi:hypothetical protein